MAMRGKQRTPGEVCADCGAPDPGWASINHGVLICDECCSVHRSLGRHISQVRPLHNGPPAPRNLLEMVQTLVSSGANSIWEHSLLDPSQVKSGKRKPSPSDPIHPTKSEFIRAKYQRLDFVHRLPTKDDDGVTTRDLSKQLHSSVRTVNVETCLRLLSLGAQSNFFHPDKGNTPLHVAAKAGQMLQAELLIVYGGDPGAFDVNGKTPLDYAKSEGHLDLAERLVECQYELTDRLAYYLCGKKPDHSIGQHFIVPEMADSSLDRSELAKAAKTKLQALPNHLFEELAMDVYDEVDRRELDSVWLTTRNHSTLVNDKSVIPFLPVNPEFSSTRNQAKEAQRRKKHTKEAELVAKCRQSLELDKEKITNRRAHLHALHHKKEEKKEVADNSEIKGRISNRPLSVIQSRGGDSNRTSVTSSGLIDYSREDTFASYISEVDGMEGQPEELPQHKSELYRLFGTKQANYFLYPRIEPIKKKKIRVNPALRRQGGRAGASTLWSILRGQSRVKLVQADQRIPSELKDAYGAFVRECLTRHKTVAKRSFYSETEVPESEKIQDSSYHERVREMKNKMELMFRAAQLNEDKTSILLFNNPPPDFNDLEGQEGLMRYHPSWVPDEDEILEEDYKRWLKRKPIDWPTMEGEKDPQRLEVITPNDSCPTTAKCEVTDDESEDSDDWLINMIVNKPEEEVKEEKPKIKPPPKLVFLTEDMCKEEGKFWKKGKKNEIPEPLRHEESKPPPTQIKSMSAMAKRKANKTGLLEGNSSTIRRSNTAPPKADFAGSSDEKKTSWQPLTLNALTEYKPSFETSGQGSFRHGQDVLWKPILSTKS
uniref:Ankyrin repeat domain-containing protein 11-like n=1 Tax=Saccoglossus kowalevskii TaxID=10224 RepID=A0ABM0GL63_SACKO|nr:PREDICTED: ankyrin repeat domain-containing protein 11-like [Saccoglossus kowalevskii]